MDLVVNFIMYILMLIFLLGGAAYSTSSDSALLTNAHYKTDPILQTANNYLVISEIIGWLSVFGLGLYILFLVGLPEYFAKGYFISVCVAAIIILFTLVSGVAAALAFYKMNKSPNFNTTNNPNDNIANKDSTVSMISYFTVTVMAIIALIVLLLMANKVIPMTRVAY